MGLLRLVLEYDGTEFDGWQVQAAGRTVQGELEAALAAIVGRPVRVVGAGRTDAGVHAEGQVASGVLETALDAETLQRALDAHLPRDLAVVGLDWAPPGFHALRDARGKLYRYAVWNGCTRSPLRARRAAWVRSPLDVAPMAAAAEGLLGTHDFAAFQTAGSDVRTTVRSLTRLEVSGKRGGEIRFDVEGSGFLRHMVRNLVGSLLEVGRGRREPGWIAAVLAGCDRRAAGPTAPARGLTLVRVDY